MGETAQILLGRREVLEHPIPQVAKALAQRRALEEAHERFSGACSESTEACNRPAVCVIQKSVRNSVVEDELAPPGC